MVGSPSSIIMLGLGNGTFPGSPSLILTLGYGSNGTTPVEEVPICAHVSASSIGCQISAASINCEISTWEC